MQIASQRMAERQQGLTDGEIGVAGGTAGAYGEEVSTEPGEEEVYLSDPGSSSNSTRDLRELRMVYVRYEGLVPLRWSGDYCRPGVVTKRSALRTSTTLSVAVQRSPLAVKRFH